MSTEPVPLDGRSAKYEELQGSRPALFFNPEHGGIRILLDPRDIARVEGNARDRLIRAGLAPAWGTVGVVYEDEYLLILRDAVRFPDGSEGTYVRLLPQNDAVGVAILPILDDEFVLVRHHRHATRQWHLEIPRGFGTAVSSPMADARRELTEELGASIKQITSLGALHVDTGLLGHRVELYLAVVSALGLVDTAEAIEAAVRVSGPELRDLIRAGVITDACTLAALTAARARGLIAPEWTPRP